MWIYSGNTRCTLPQILEKQHIMSQNQDQSQVWRTTLAQIEIKLDNPAQYKTFFSGAELLAISDDTAQIAVPNPFTSDWLRQKHSQLIADTISHVYGKKLSLEFVVSGRASSEVKQPVSAPLLDIEAGIPAQLSKLMVTANLNPKYTLGSFISGESNRMAYAAASAVINSPGVAYNPLFIYGPTGVGKTHLAQAVGHCVLERTPNKRITYIPAEGFLNDLVKSIQTKRTHDFRLKYRQTHVLIIDDIQLISKNWIQTQVELFNTFNELHNAGHQIILISDRRPEEIKDIEDRLRSRFQGGMVVDIAKPDFELRLAILEKKAMQGSLNVSRTVMETLAREINDNVRELEGALQKVALFAQVKPSGELTLDEVARIIGVDSQSKRETIKVADVIKVVATNLGVKAKDLKGPRRTKDIAFARQVCMYILREELGYKLEDIAKFLNRSDHTTVMHAVDKIHSATLCDIDFRQRIQAIISELTSTN